MIDIKYILYERIEIRDRYRLNLDIKSPLVPTVNK